MIRSIPNASLFENLKFSLLYLLPYYLKGLFLRNRFWVGLFAAVHPDPQGVRFATRLRARYQSDMIRLRPGRSETVLVMGGEPIQRVLSASPMIYAEPAAKRRGMSHFEPDAVTISRLPLWSTRRRFNEDALEFGRAVHSSSRRFLEVVREEVGAPGRFDGPSFGYPAFDACFGKIAARVILGDAARDDHEVFTRLRHLMRQANRMFGLSHSRELVKLQAAIQRYLDLAESGSLAAACASLPSSEQTAATSQLTHWLFAMRDTLPMNVAQTLALIVSHPSSRATATEEAKAPIPSSPKAGPWPYLTACLKEAMRLWPTTPMLQRETVCSDVLGDHVVPSGATVMIWNDANHRDPTWTHDPDRFLPGRFLEGDADSSPIFNALSRGPQVCAGQDLVLSIGAATVAAILERGEYRLATPKLVADQPLPHAFNVFGLTFNRA